MIRGNVPWNAAFRFPMNVRRSIKKPVLAVNILWSCHLLWPFLVRRFGHDHAFVRVHWLVCWPPCPHCLQETPYQVDDTIRQWTWADCFDGKYWSTIEFLRVRTEKALSLLHMDLRIVSGFASLENFFHALEYFCKRTGVLPCSVNSYMVLAVCSFVNPLGSWFPSWWARVSLTRMSFEVSLSRFGNGVRFCIFSSVLFRRKCLCESECFVRGSWIVNLYATWCAAQHFACQQTSSCNWIAC